ncbi:MAG: phenylacetate--CoA ligase family protein [Deltaproteobacteria bacterium]|nr:phenylacetate--CoA ligase family protein [Deltaproteobacteria bacterium]
MAQGIAWPALHGGATAMTLALAWQLERSQWWTPDELRRHQQRQLALVARHAATTVALYEERWAGLDPTDPAQWHRLPLVSRADVIAAGPRLLSRRYPADHGRIDEVRTSRTSGEPVRVRTTEVVHAMWKALTLRDHAWHRRDLDAHLAAIRYAGPEVARPPDGARSQGWGPATAALAPEAPMSLLSVDSTTDEQVDWLARVDPVYLIVYPSVLGAIARRVAERGVRLPSLRQVRTISEALSADTRALCREALGVPLVDTYSAEEVGYLAMQCPERETYHVPAERVLVEVLDDAGAPCGPGEVGRVVVTDLHNFASPLVRYDIGDYAEVGAPCPCGRGLPVLNRIVGRRRNMLVYPDGRTAWPLFTVACREAAPYVECQLVQDTAGAVRLRVVPHADRPIDEDDRAALAAALRASLHHPFDVAIEVVDRLARSPAGKLEEFVSYARTGITNSCDSSSP